MKLRLGADEIDLGRASTMSGLGAKLVQSEDLTATGKAYTVTWNYYTGKGWKFGWDWMEESILDDLALFHLTIAKAKQNVFEIDLDNDTTVGNCRFLSNPINIGEQEVIISNGVEQTVYMDVGFDIEVVP